jgi:hypothetical protein
MRNSMLVEENRNISLIDSEDIVFIEEALKRIDWYEIEIEGKLVKFFPKLTEWSDAYYGLLLFPGDDFPKFNCLRKGYKPPIRVKDFNSGKLNKKCGGGDNFIDPAQGRITGATDIWNDHSYIVDLADALELMQKNCRDDVFKWFGKIIAYAVRVDNSDSIPHELIVDFEPEDTIVKAIMGKIVSGHMKFMGMDEIFEIAKIGSIAMVHENGNWLFKISPKDKLQKEDAYGAVKVKNVASVHEQIQEHLEAEISSYVENNRKVQESGNNSVKIEDEIRVLEDSITGCYDSIASLENQLDMKKKQVGSLENQRDMKKKELEEKIRQGNVCKLSADNNKKRVHELIDKLMDGQLIMNSD